MHFALIVSCLYDTAETIANLREMCEKCGPGEFKPQFVQCAGFIVMAQMNAKRVLYRNVHCDNWSGNNHFANVKLGL